MKRTILIFLVIAVFGGCATPHPPAPTVVVVCEDNAAAARAQIEAVFSQEIDQPWYEESVSWINRYGGFGALLALPFLIW